MRLLQSRSLQICILIASYLLIASHLPNWAHASLYTVSMFIKDLLLWMLPITVSLFIAHAIASFEKKAFLFLLSLFLFEAISNTCSVWYAYGCAHLAKGSIPIFQTESLVNPLEPLFRLPLLKPSWWSADKGTMLGIVLGLAATFFPLKSVITRGKTVVEKILTSFFARLIPLFVLGFVARMYKMKLLSSVAFECADLLLLLFASLAVYICFLFLLGGGPNTPSFLQRIKNLLPAMGLAFSSGCSLSTMPWTISGTAKNLNDPELAKGVIPATTNIQQVGDCIVNGFFCFIIFYYFNGYTVDPMTWLSFSVVFILARFATAAVLGGAIFLMLPIYEAYLGFTPEMIALILAFNVLLDPLVTSSNVIANGAMCRVFERYWNRIQARPRLQAR